MKKILLILIASVCFNVLLSQSNDCTTATPISVTATCVTPTNGTTIGATQSIPGCTGNADDDVWYSFVATSTAHQIIVTPSGGMDPVVQLFANSCGLLNNLVCRDLAANGGVETINYSGLTIGVTYRIRVYHYGAGAGTGTFSICVTNPPPAPVNDGCSNPTPLSVNSSCTPTNGTTVGASQSFAGCAGNADDDVWYSFVATSSVQEITVTPTSNIDLVFQVYNGTCGSLNSITCIDNTFSSSPESTTLVGLIPGNTYLVRVYDYYAGNNGTFNICVEGTVTPTPSNDEPCNAIQMPAVTANCQYAQFTNVGATSTTLANAPTPSNCQGGGGAMIGGYGASTADVWFAITVPSSGNVHITSKPNIGGGAITDGVMALYSGTCNSLTQIACSDDNTAYPGGGNDLLPLISANGLVPGSTVYLRYWGFGTSQGTFGFCVTTATNDECANALYICDLNGYSASTSGAYTPDRPGNMHGNNETSDGVNLTNGIDSGGPFGSAGPWGNGSPFVDVNIENNSWIKFTAAATTATLQVSIFDCWVGNYPSGGIQMQIFDGINCDNFIPVSNFEESSTGFTITGNDLTVGNDYYLMIDGYAGDICNYTITAESGVQFPDIADVAPICIGESVVLTAPPGATSYNWLHDGSSTQSVEVTPGSSQTYYCVVTGLCDYSQTLEVDVELKPLPEILINSGNPAIICNGESINLTASGATSYTWSTSQSQTTINVSPTTSTLYSVTGTLNGCTSDQSINVVVNNPPTLNVGATVNEADCGTANGDVTNISANGAPTLDYEWFNNSSVSISTNQNLTNVVAGLYTLVVTDGNGCSLDTVFNIGNLNFPNPTFIVSDLTPCVGDDILLTASHPDGTATFTWTGPGVNAGNESQNPLTINTSVIGNGNYSVTATIPGCIASSNPQTVNVLNLPTITINALNDDSTICLNGSTSLTASGDDSYSWEGPNGFNSSNETISIAPFTATNEGYYSVTSIDVNGCSNQDSMEIVVLALPLIDVTANNGTGNYCNSFNATLNATGGANYQWSGPNGFSSTMSNPTIFSLSQEDEGWYTVIGTDIENCTNSDSILISIYPELTDVIAEGDSVICPGEDVQFNASGASSYIWSGPMNLYTENASFVVYNTSINNEGWYYLTVTDENGCVSQDSTYLAVQPNAGCLTISDLITPDDDGHNDEWVIYGLENFLDATVEIYNRWGNLIYSASPYKNDWDGTVNHGATIGSSGKAPVGTYFYIIILNDPENTPPFKGYLEVQY